MKPRSIVTVVIVLCLSITGCSGTKSRKAAVPSQLTAAQCRSMANAAADEIRASTPNSRAARQAVLMIQSLGHFADDAVRRLAKKPPRGHSSNILLCLRYVRRNTSIEVGRGFLSDADPSVRAAAGLCLADAGDKRSMSHFLAFARSKVASDREVAAYAFGKLKAVEQIRLTSSLASDADPGVRRAAIVAIGILNPTKGVPVFLRMTADINDEVAAIAYALAFRHERARGEVSALVCRIRKRLRVTGSPNRLSMFLRGLAASRSPAVAPIFETYLRSSTSGIRRVALESVQRYPFAEQSVMAGIARKDVDRANRELAIIWLFRSDVVLGMQCASELGNGSKTYYLSLFKMLAASAPSRHGKEYLLAQLEGRYPVAAAAALTSLGIPAGELRGVPERALEQFRAGDEAKRLALLDEVNSYQGKWIEEIQAAARLDRSEMIRFEAQKKTVAMSVPQS